MASSTHSQPLPAHSQPSTLSLWGFLWHLYLAEVSAAGPAAACVRAALLVEVDSSSIMCLGCGSWTHSGSLPTFWRLCAVSVHGTVWTPAFCSPRWVPDHGITGPAGDAEFKPLTQCPNLGCVGRGSPQSLK